jgi:hypothetical protein
VVQFGRRPEQLKNCHPEAKDLLFASLNHTPRIFKLSRYLKL